MLWLSAYHWIYQGGFIFQHNSLQQHQFIDMYVLVAHFSLSLLVVVHFCSNVFYLSCRICNARAHIMTDPCDRRPCVQEESRSTSIHRSSKSEVDRGDPDESVRNGYGSRYCRIRSCCHAGIVNACSRFNVSSMSQRSQE